MSTIIDDTAVIKTLSLLSKNLDSRGYKNATTRAARKGGNVLKNEIRSKIPDTGGFEHIGTIKRNVKVTNSKASNRYPGVNVLIKGTDVQVGQGKSRRFWKLANYAYLVLFGNYRTLNRIKGGSKSKGNVEGITNTNVFREVEKSHGSKALNIFIDNLIPQLRKQISKSVRK